MWAHVVALTSIDFEDHRIRAQTIIGPAISDGRKELLANNKELRGFNTVLELIL